MSDGNIHVMPTHDIKQHEESLECWCCPKRDVEQANLVVHNAFAEEYGEERNLE
jgi:hypothetical protein